MKIQFNCLTETNNHNDELFFRIISSFITPTSTCITKKLNLIYLPKLQTNINVDFYPKNEKNFTEILNTIHELTPKDLCIASDSELKFTLCKLEQQELDTKKESFVGTLFAKIDEKQVPIIFVSIDNRKNQQKVYINSLFSHLFLKEPLKFPNFQTFNVFNLSRLSLSDESQTIRSEFKQKAIQKINDELKQLTPLQMFLSLDEMAKNNNKLFLFKEIMNNWLDQKKVKIRLVSERKHQLLQKIIDNNAGILNITSEVKNFNNEHLKVNVKIEVDIDKLIANQLFGLLNIEKLNKTEVLDVQSSLQKIKSALKTNIIDLTYFVEIHSIMPNDTILINVDLKNSLFKLPDDEINQVIIGSPQWVIASLSQCIGNVNEISPFDFFKIKMALVSKNLKFISLNVLHNGLNNINYRWGFDQIKTSYLKQTFFGYIDENGNEQKAKILNVINHPDINIQNIVQSELHKSIDLANINIFKTENCWMEWNIFITNPSDGFKKIIEMEQQFSSKEPKNKLFLDLSIDYLMV